MHTELPVHAGLQEGIEAPWPLFAPFCPLLPELEPELGASAPAAPSELPPVPPWVCPEVASLPADESPEELPPASWAGDCPSWFAESSPPLEEVSWSAEAWEDPPSSSLELPLVPPVELSFPFWAPPGVRAPGPPVPEPQATL